MMVKLINRQTGGPMWVHESRKSEYLAAGHQLASKPKEPESTQEEKMPEPEREPEPEPEPETESAEEPKPEKPGKKK